MKTALYSVTYAGIWYDGGPLSIEELIACAKKYGYEGIEIDGKRPHGFPLDWDEKRRATIRKLAKESGIEIIGVAGNNNLVSPFVEDRENELLMMSEQIKLARDLEAKIVRVFMAWPGITYIDGKANYDIPRRYAIDGFAAGPDATALQRWRWAKECLVEASEIAKRYGVTLALQNHHPYFMYKNKTYLDMLEMVREVNSEFLKCSLDCPLLATQEDDYVTQAVRDTGKLEVISHFGGEFVHDTKGEVRQVPCHGFDSVVNNYTAFVRALKETGYEGYLSYELCHSVLNNNHELAGIERAHEQVSYASRYMHNIIRSV